MSCALMLALVVGMNAFERELNAPPKAYPIVSKHEQDDKCYLMIEVEVSPEEYIGYDTGDEYELRGTL